jgi:hypothetical protein
MNLQSEFMELQFTYDHIRYRHAGIRHEPTFLLPRLSHFLTCLAQLLQHRFHKQLA